MLFYSLLWVIFCFGWFPLYSLLFSGLGIVLVLFGLGFFVWLFCFFVRWWVYLGIFIWLVSAFCLFGDFCLFYFNVASTLLPCLSKFLRCWVHSVSKSICLQSYSNFCKSQMVSIPSESLQKDKHTASSVLESDQIII